MRQTKLPRNIPLSFVLILIITSIFFFYLCIPPIQIFSHPDYGLSDLWHSGYPSRFLLQESVHNGQLLIWTPKFGMGMPELAKAEVGALYVFNILFFYFFSFPYALNLLYICAFLTATIGTYIYLRSHNLKPISSVIGSIAFSFGAYFITHLSHISRIQTASMLPLILYFYERLFKRPTLFMSLVLSLLLAQQLYAGHFQVVFMTNLTLAGIGLYYIFIKKITKKAVFYLLLTFFLYVLLAAVQLLPSLELIHLTQRGAGFNVKEALQFSYPWSQLITMVDPFKLGTPSTGRWPFFGVNNGNIYWENMGFIGITGLVLAVFGFATHRMKKKFVLFAGIVVFMALLMMTGKYSPLYLIHTILPFSYFRAPSKYILIFVFFLCILAAYGAEALHTFLVRHMKLKKQATYVLIGVLFLLTFELWRFHKAYTVYDDAAKLLSPPPVINHIKSDTTNTFRYVSLHGGKAWNSIFLDSGWTSMEEFYYLRNLLEPDINGLYGVQSFGVYNILLTNRFRLTQTLLQRLEVESIKTQETTAFQKYLGMMSIKYLISPENGPYGKLIQTFSPPKSYVKRKLPPVKLYETDAPLPRYRMVFEYIRVHSDADVWKVLHQDSFQPQNTALLEAELPIGLEKDGKGNVAPILLENERIELEAVSDRKGLLVLADSYYPGWKARIDGKETRIYPANINQRAIIVPSGRHIVTFVYQPQSFAQGKMITAVGYLLIGLLAVSHLFVKWRQGAFAKRRSQTNEDRNP